MKAILFSFLLVIVPAGGGEFWEDKNYTQWSPLECALLLIDSPWAKSYKTNSYVYHAQFLSALPIRQAIVRRMQITQNYENLSLQRRQESDKRSEEYLSQQFTDSIVINVEYGGTSVGYWRSWTTELLKNYVYLIVNNRKIPLLQFSQSRDSASMGSIEFQFVFPRPDKDPAIRSAKDEFIRLEFPTPRNQASNKSSDGGLFEPETVLIEFKVNKMRVKGKVLY